MGRTSPSAALRVALIAGGLGQGGAEKQLTYLARALRQAGASVTVFSLTRGEHYQSVLASYGIPVVWAGQKTSPLARAAALVRMLSADRPHIVQSTHFFTNLYAAVAGRALGVVSIGSVRSNVFREVRANGLWGPLLLRLPQTLILNSALAQRNAISAGVNPRKLFVLPNVIDLAEFDAAPPAQARPSAALTVISVARLIQVKRMDLLLAALALVREQAGPAIRAVIVGDGPERPALEEAARRLALPGEAIAFTGMRGNVAALLREADVFVLSSEVEGFPNAVLEAMAARLPVIATPAGDTPVIVQDGATGFLVPHNDPTAIAQRLLELAAAPNLRAQMGQAGRARAEQLYSFQSLPRRLLELYAQIARQQNNTRALQALNCS